MYILKNVGNQMVLVKIDFHMDKTTFQIQHTFFILGFFFLNGPKIIIEIIYIVHIHFNFFLLILS